MFNSSFSKFLTKNHPPFQYLILNKNLNENDDVDDDNYKLFCNKKTGKNLRGWEKIKVFGQIIYQ